MKASRRRAALQRAAGSVALNSKYTCEPLEKRVLLDATGDPVIDGLSFVVQVPEPGSIASCLAIGAFLTRSR